MNDDTVETLPLFDESPFRSALWKEFEKFDAAHPDIWQQFESIALDLIHRGKTHYSADSILHVIRFHRDTSTSGADVKINNNFSACYARKWAKRHPDYEKFFERRKSKVDPKPQP